MFMTVVVIKLLQERILQPCEIQIQLFEVLEPQKDEETCSQGFVVIEESLFMFAEIIVSVTYIMSGLENPYTET